MKKQKILLIISIVVLTIGIGLLIAGTALSLTHHNLLSDIFLGVSSILGLAALALLVWRLAIMPSVAPRRQNRPTVYVKTVDVKDIPKSNEEKLYEQYEDLYKRKLISKEELDKKRIELLGK